jgi:hypothetical protein
MEKPRGRDETRARYDGVQHDDIPGHSNAHQASAQQTSATPPRADTQHRHTLTLLLIATDYPLGMNA